MISKTGNSKQNVCRNLHSLLRRNKALFPVDIDVAPVTVAVRRPVYRTEAVWWPVLPMSAWVKALWSEAPSTRYMLMVMTKGSVYLSFYMVMKEEDNVDDHLW